MPNASDPYGHYAHHQAINKEIKFFMSTMNLSSPRRSQHGTTLTDSICGSTGNSPNATVTLPNVPSDGLVARSSHEIANTTSNSPRQATPRNGTSRGAPHKSIPPLTVALNTFSGELSRCPIPTSPSRVGIAQLLDNSPRHRSAVAINAKTRDSLLTPRQSARKNFDDSSVKKLEQTEFGEGERKHQLTTTFGSLADTQTKGHRPSLPSLGTNQFHSPRRMMHNLY